MVREKNKLIVVIDSNEYLLFLTDKHPDFCKIFSNRGISIYITDLIVRGVLRNLEMSTGRIFYKFIKDNNILFHPSMNYYSLFQKYKELGLKKGDIIIASFCEGIGAKYLITENRHLLKSKIKHFEVLNLQEFLRLLS